MVHLWVNWLAIILVLCAYVVGIGAVISVIDGVWIEIDSQVVIRADCVVLVGGLVYSLPKILVEVTADKTGL